MRVALVALVAAGAAFGGDGRQVAILYQGDNGGEVAPCGCKGNPTGGLAKRTTVVEGLKATNFVALDSGNALFRNAGVATDADRARAQFIFEVMARQGVRAMAVGQRDLSAGLEFLQSAARKSALKLLSANLKKKGALVFDASTIIDAQGLKIAIVGVTAPGPVVPSDPDATADGTASSVKAALAKLGKRDVTILLAATSYPDALQLGLELNSQVDFIIQSGEFRGTQPPQLVDGTKVYLLASGQRGQAMGKLQLEFGNSKSGFVDLSAADRDRQQVEFVTSQLSVVEQRLAVAKDKSAVGDLKTVRDQLKGRQAMLKKSADATAAKGARTMRLDWLILGSDVADDASVKQEVLKHEPTYAGN